MSKKNKKSSTNADMSLELIKTSLEEIIANSKDNMFKYHILAKLDLEGSSLENKLNHLLENVHKKNLPDYSEEEEKYSKRNKNKKIKPENQDHDFESLKEMLVSNQESIDIDQFELLNDTNLVIEEASDEEFLNTNTHFKNVKEDDEFHMLDNTAFIEHSDLTNDFDILTN